MVVRTRAACFFAISTLEPRSQSIQLISRHLEEALNALLRDGLADLHQSVEVGGEGVAPDCWQEQF